jgi:hypothetical protein
VFGWVVEEMVEQPAVENHDGLAFAEAEPKQLREQEEVGS